MRACVDAIDRTCAERCVRVYCDFNMWLSLVYARPCILISTIIGKRCRFKKVLDNLYVCGIISLNIACMNIVFTVKSDRS